MAAPPRILVLGYGNPGREDDGLGPAVAEAITRLELPGVTVDSDYQLQVEDSHAIAQHDAVVFVDAAVEGEEPFFFLPVRAEREITFSSHSIQPGSLLGMTLSAFGREVPAWAMGIRGYSFEPFQERLTPQAQQNLAAAVEFLADLLRRQGLPGTAG